MSLLNTETDTRGVTTITLNRSETGNALTRALIDEITAALVNLKSNTRILVIEGAGKHFCAGADVNWMIESAKLTTDDNKADAMALSNMLDALDTFTRPTIAKVHGAAFGGGAGIVSCCDIVVAAETARFAFSEVRLGLIPSTISPYAIAAIGARNARHYFLTGEQMDAVDAYRLGLVHDVCSEDNLQLRVEEKIDALCKASPTAQTQAKQLIKDVQLKAINNEVRESLAEGLANVRTGEDAREGLTAFIEKRAPRWRW